MKCKCGGEMEYHRGIVEGADYIQCNKCGYIDYINKEVWS